MMKIIGFVIQTFFKKGCEKVILKLENDKEIDIYNMTCDEAEMFCDFLIKKFIEENDV